VVGDIASDGSVRGADIPVRRHHFVWNSEVPRLNRVGISLRFDAHFFETDGQHDNCRITVFFVAWGKKSTK
jgi:hypothetical protein